METSMLLLTYKNDCLDFTSIKKHRKPDVSYRIKGA